MRYLPIAVKLLLLAYLCYLTVYLAVDYAGDVQRVQPPLLIWLMDTIDLFIHEAGHFLLRPFGLWIHVIGGSLVQCLLPLLLLIVTWKQNVAQVAYPGFWLGENLVNVSVYIRDAPYRNLRLIASGLIHDWNWLLSGDLDAAEPLADIVFVLGLLVCVGAIAAGGYALWRNFRESEALTK